MQMTQINDRFPSDLRELEKKIGYRFKNRILLMTSLCHSSYSNEKKGTTLNSNERLEFLGDSVLSIIVSEYLYSSLPEKSEGELSTIRREIIDGNSLTSFARSIDLGDYMLFGNGEEKNGGRERKTNLEDAFEALAGAMFLDGGLDAVKTFFLPFVGRAIENIFKTKRFNDPKSELQELVQQNGETLRYELIGESGPDHDKRFIACVKLNSNIIGRGEGKRKQEAEMNAALEALRLFGEKKENE